MTQASAEQAGAGLAIRDPYVFEFLGLKAKDAVAETDLEDALLDHLQEFLLELGHGFCFEARQKNIIIGLLLCTGKDHALVEYALAGLDNALFVSKYQLELPSQQDLVRFLEQKRREVGDHDAETKKDERP
jgi:hypothetical protein